MSLVDDIKLSLRIVTDDFDPEIRALADAAMADMERVGVRPELLELDDDGNLLRRNALVWQAVVAFCKSRFGFDNGDAGRFEDAYYRTVVDLMNSTANVADESYELPPLPEPDDPAQGQPDPGKDPAKDTCDETGGGDAGDGEAR